MKSINKKGFTLVELIAVIVVLSVVLTITILSVNSISLSIKEKEKENLISYIKTAAEKYYNSTGVNVVFVEQLIQNSYLDADDTNDNGTKMIKDPVSGESMNCYYAEVNANETIVHPGDSCNYEIYKDSIIGMRYCSKTSASAVCYPNADVPSDWIGGSFLTLGGVSLDGTIDFAGDVTFSWTNPDNPDIAVTDRYYNLEVPSTGVVNGKFRLTVFQKGKEYSVEKEIKVDAKAPIAKNVQIDCTEEAKSSSYTSSACNSNPEDAFAKSKYVLAKLIDNESGLLAYAVTQSKSMPSDSEWKTISGAPKEYDLKAVMTDNGDYYLWVKDLAGNTNIGALDDTKVTLKHVDSTPPSCTSSGDNSSWTNSNVTLYWGCNDGSGENVSGCATSTSSKTINYSTTTYTKPSYTIYDNAGNSKTCPSKTANVYVDKDMPTCYTSGENTTWKKTPVTITYGCYDGTGSGASGCTTSNKTVSFSNSQYTYYVPSYTISDRAGNSKTCPARNLNVYIDTDAPSCYSYGGNSSWTNRDVTIYWGCSDSGSGCSTSTSSKTFTSSTKTYYRSSYTISDRAGNYNSCPAKTYDIYVDKDAPTCSTTGGNSTWTNSDVTFTVTCNDGNSSTSSGCVNASKTVTVTSSMKSYKMTADDVRDRAGNVGSCEVPVYIDKEGPKCKYTGESTVWTNGSRYITWGCDDGNGSGCKVDMKGSKTFTSTKETYTISSFTIEDNMGNKVTCPSYKANVYVDTTLPTGTLSVKSSNSTYHTPNVTVTINGSDSHSGVKAVCIKKTQGSSGCTWHYSSTYSFSETVSSGQDGTKVTYYGYIMDNAGNIKEKKTTYTVYKLCNTKHIDHFDPDYKKCSCGATRKRTAVYVDYYFPDVSCGTSESGTCYEADGTKNKCKKTCAACDSGGGGGDDSGGGGGDSGEGCPNPHECDPWTCTCGDWPNGCCTQYHNYQCC